MITDVGETQSQFKKNKEWVQVSRHESFAFLFEVEKTLTHFAYPEHCFETRICCTSKTLLHNITSLVPFLDRHILLFFCLQRWHHWNQCENRGKEHFVCRDRPPILLTLFWTTAISQDKDIRYVLLLHWNVPNKMPVVVFRVPVLL